jgi:hypothetical protein
MHIIGRITYKFDLDTAFLFGFSSYMKAQFHHLMIVRMDVQRLARWAYLGMKYIRFRGASTTPILGGDRTEWCIGRNLHYEKRHRYMRYVLMRFRFPISTDNGTPVETGAKTTKLDPLTWPDGWDKTGIQQVVHHIRAKAEKLRKTGA